MLENSGVRVHEIAEYEDLPLLVTELVARPAGWETTPELARIRRAERTDDLTRLAERRGDLDTRQLGE